MRFPRPGQSLLLCMLPFFLNYKDALPGPLLWPRTCATTSTGAIHQMLFCQHAIKWFEIILDHTVLPITPSEHTKKFKYLVKTHPKTQTITNNIKSMNHRPKIHLLTSKHSYFDEHIRIKPKHSGFKTNLWHKLQTTLWTYFKLRNNNLSLISS